MGYKKIESFHLSQENSKFSLVIAKLEVYIVQEENDKQAVNEIL